jgi:predicted transcriptional regulator
VRSQPYFSPAEWEVLQYVTQHHPVSAREVADEFARTHGWARTTVLTLMARLRDKGYLTRERCGGMHRYSPSAPRHELLLRLVREFVQKALGGSASPFVTYLTREATLTAEEQEELKRLVQSLDAPGAAPDE